MKGTIQKSTPVWSHRRVIARAAEVLLHDGVIGYPTETVYGLGGDARSSEAALRIFKLKKRESGKPVPVLVASAEEALSLIKGWTAEAESLMKSFWPGPLTLVFEASPGLPETITGDTGRVALRVSPDPVVRALLGIAKIPLISTSANHSGDPPACSAKEVFHYFPEGLDMILDGGPRLSGLPSTVLDVTRTPPVVLRAGAIAPEALRRVAGDVYGP